MQHNSTSSVAPAATQKTGVKNSAWIARRVGWAAGWGPVSTALATRVLIRLQQNTVSGDRRDGSLEAGDVRCEGGPWGRAALGPPTWLSSLGVGAWLCTAWQCARPCSSPHRSLRASSTSRGRASPSHRARLAVRAASRPHHRTCCRPGLGTAEGFGGAATVGRPSHGLHGPSPHRGPPGPPNWATGPAPSCRGPAACAQATPSGAVAGQSPQGSPTTRNAQGAG